MLCLAVSASRVCSGIAQSGPFPQEVVVCICLQFKDYKTVFSPFSMEQGISDHQFIQGRRGASLYPKY